jgi:CP family cyanate transporter-like MFS transporter
VTGAEPAPEGPWRGSRPGDGLLLAAVLLGGLNLRGAIAAVAPVLPELRADLGLTPSAAGLLTTLPVLCFAALAPAAAWLGRAVGARNAVLGGLVAIAAGSALRVVDGPAVLLAGTFVVGAAMTVGNILLPVVVKSAFPARAGTVTGMYTTALVAGAALTSGLTAPIAVVWGWRAGLAVWSLVAVLAAAVWFAATGRRPTEQARGRAVRARVVPVSVWRSPVAWAVTAVLALQSALYYAVTAWLPSLLIDDAGLNVRTAAFAAAMFQLLGIPGALLVPVLLSRLRNQRGLAVVVAAGWALLVLGLAVEPAAWPIWVGIGGVAQGAGIAIAMALVALRAADHDVVTRLSAMSQLVGYTIGACGPLVVGGLYAAGDGWGTPLVVLLGGAAALGVAGALAGRGVQVGGPGRSTARPGAVT